MIPPLVLRLIDHAGLYWTVEVLDGSGALVNDADAVERETAVAFAAWLSGSEPETIRMNP